MTAADHITRRRFVGASAATAAALALGTRAVLADPAAPRWRFPAEGDRHERTLMSWPHTIRLYGDLATVQGLRADLARIAHAIARFEPVLMVVHPDDRANAASMLGAGIEILELPVDDLWMRDAGPLIVVDDHGRRAARGLNFNEWGGKTRQPLDERLAPRVARELGLPFVAADLVGEGGALELDGSGDALICASSLQNANRNPGLSRADLEAALRAALGVTHVTWFTGLKGQDITDFHVDAMARFVAPGRVLIQQPPRSANDVFAKAERRSLDELRAASTADGKAYRIEILHDPVNPRIDSLDYVDCYANYLLVNGGIIAGQFGDARTDAAAGETLARLHPGRQVVQLNIDNVAMQGGGIHCATQQVPAV
jgi:agmatine deiminase